jgi:catechol 2,3-dioxygenase-like lactoylglutathione lyase family enzyme
MLPRGIDHVGMTVPDIEEATRFLEDAFGAIPLYDIQTPEDPPMAGIETETELGLSPGAQVIHMRLLRLGNGPSIELFQFNNADQTIPATLQDYGFQHIALYVDDLDSAAERFVGAGGTLLSTPNKLISFEAGKRNKWVYGRLPWGSLVEFITYPDGLQIPVDRWTPPLADSHWYG